MAVAEPDCSITVSIINMQHLMSSPGHPANHSSALRCMMFMLFCLMTTPVLFAQKKENKPVSKTTPLLHSASDSTQYAIGAFMAQWMSRNGLAIQDANLFSKGMNDVLFTGSKLLPDSIVLQRVSAFQQNGLKEKAQHDERELFTLAKSQPGIGMLPSGVHYLVLRPGDGNFPGPKDTLVLDLIARLPDGTVVEDTYKEKKPFTVTMAGLFPGLSDPLRIMQRGARWQLFIPAALAYADKGTRLIPPNTALVIEVELKEIHPAR